MITERTGPSYHIFYYSLSGVGGGRLKDFEGITWFSGGTEGGSVVTHRVSMGRL